MLKNNNYMDRKMKEEQLWKRNDHAKVINLSGRIQKTCRILFLSYSEWENWKMIKWLQGKHILLLTDINMRNVNSDDVILNKTFETVKLTVQQSKMAIC